jgi:TRAP-type C4-dicarboxylate transport system permease small subunit
MQDAAPETAGGAQSLARRVIEWWALAGGLVLLGVALMTTWSSASSVLFKKPLPGDFELVEMLIAVSVFSFLPYCQLTGANVTADIFTARAGPRTVALLGALSAAIALGFSLLLGWRMTAGLQDYRQYVETTAILRIPIWYAYIPALASLALLALSACLSLGDAIDRWKRAR